METITLNGIEYTPVAPAPTGTRAVVVVDRGWIFAGDVAETPTGLTLTNAIHVLRWESIGFDGMLADPKSNKVTLKKMPYPVEIPHQSVIFRVPVVDSWGA